MTAKIDRCFFMRHRSLNLSANAECCRPDLFRLALERVGHDPVAFGRGFAADFYLMAEALIMNNSWTQGMPLRQEFQYTPSFNEFIDLRWGSNAKNIQLYEIDIDKYYNYGAVTVDSFTLHYSSSYATIDEFHLSLGVFIGDDYNKTNDIMQSLIALSGTVSIPALSHRGLLEAYSNEYNQKIQVLLSVSIDGVESSSTAGITFSGTFSLHGYYEYDY